jgi:phosphopantothenoylcysteine decarboxylase/phosphopantothenate--cysteine ligase
VAKKPEKLKKSPSEASISDRSVQKISKALLHKRVALAVSGGIGATEIVKIARELRRHGAQVHAFLNPEALRFITALSVEWATENKVVLEAGARVEYLDEFDFVVVSPATLHTISKAALGLSQTVVDLVIANQLGKKRTILFVPAMNESLWDHPVLPEHLKQLEDWGAKIFPAAKNEARVKVPDAKELITWIIKEVKA